MCDIEITFENFAHEDEVSSIMSLEPETSEEYMDPTTITQCNPQDSQNKKLRTLSQRPLMTILTQEVQKITKEPIPMDYNALYIEQSNAKNMLSVEDNYDFSYETEENRGVPQRMKKLNHNCEYKFALFENHPNK